MTLTHDIGGAIELPDAPSQGTSQGASRKGVDPLAIAGAVLEAVPYPVLIAADGRVAHANAALRQRLNGADLRGRYLEEVVEFEGLVALRAAGGGGAVETAIRLIGEPDAAPLRARAVRVAPAGGGMDLTVVAAETGTEAEAQLAVMRDVLAHLSQGVSAVDRDMRVVAWNQRFLDMLGFPQSLGTYGRSFADFIRFNAQRGEYGPGDIDGQVAERIARARQFKPHRLERERPDGTVIEIEGRPLPGGGFVTTYSDRTADKKAQKALAESEARFRTIVGAVPLPIAITRRDGNGIVYVNDAWCELSGIPRDRAIGRSVSEFYADPADRERMKAELREKGALRRYETRLKYGDKVVQALLGCEIIVLDGHECVLAVVQDVTEAKKTEEILMQAKEAAESANQMKTEFLASMSHELRTPLNAILGFSDLIRGQCFGAIGNPRYAEYAGDIHASGALLLGVINDILDLAKMEAGKAALSETEFDAAGAIGAAMRVIEPQAAKAGVSVTVASPAQPLVVRGDERRMTQVLLNLMSNATKFTPAGGRVAVTASLTAAGEPQLTVADTGIGITPEDLKRVMEPFVQVESTLSRRHGGSGLGLAIVRSLVELHGGRIELESEPGRGTTARVILPASRLAA